MDGMNINPMYRGTYVEKSFEEGKAQPLKNIIKNVASEALQFASVLPAFNGNTSVIGIPGNKANLTQFPDIVVSVQRYGSKDIPSDVAGRPLYKNVKINTLSGFVKCSGASLDIAGFSGDKEEVNAYLNSGFYFE